MKILISSDAILLHANAQNLKGEILEVTDETKTHYGVNGIYIPKIWCDIVEKDHQKESDYDLPEILAGIFLTIDECPEFEETSIDDFYDFVEIPMEDRTDFGTAALTKQTLELY